ncbi:type II toxin-antitoxin system PemK/MazF family toxin [Pannus brasiliensis CCIBt3594]|uniref:Type II toxin-antitoxin system PemK/MazF family toxin n=1 Tax=Pannus brasiliensis CCIBt3594 TaxID=1427578 RepID=A0AAW9QP50_9CHRO
MTEQKPQKPRQGWIYRIDPYQVTLTCKAGHVHFYDLDAPGEVSCKTYSCTLTINSSRVLRGIHPYIIWTSDRFLENSDYIATFVVIPLTSKETYKGLPTTYPINPTFQNGLSEKSYALINQITTVEANCFKDSSGKWSARIGQLNKDDRAAIDERLRYLLNINNNPDEDWYIRNNSPELVEKLFNFLPRQQQQETIERLIDSLE